jgi:hypothetical protein
VDYSGVIGSAQILYTGSKENIRQEEVVRFIRWAGLPQAIKPLAEKTYRAGELGKTPGGIVFALTFLLLSFLCVKTNKSKRPRVVTLMNRRKAPRNSHGTRSNKQVLIDQQARAELRLLVRRPTTAIVGNKSCCKNKHPERARQANRPEVWVPLTSLWLRFSCVRKKTLLIKFAPFPDFNVY